MDSFLHSNLIAEHVAGSELPKIRTALGNSLLDMYTDMHSEVRLWYKMWQENQQGKSSSGSRSGTPHPHGLGSPLADPPAVKELVRAEVKMLLQTLRERASTGGRGEEELVSRYKPEMVDYALGHRNCTSPERELGCSFLLFCRPSSRCSVLE
uniref:Uncharacterized protein n=1 Tax=Mola mola TaxID=94237 RepID=A0A3Q3WZY6_MOLML